MKYEILQNEYKTFYTMLLDSEVLRKALDSLPDELTLDADINKDKPAGIMNKETLTMNPNMYPPLKTVKERKEELDRQILIIKARVKEILKELIAVLELEGKGL